MPSPSLTHGHLNYHSTHSGYNALATRAEAHASNSNIRHHHDSHHDSNGAPGDAAHALRAAAAHTHMHHRHHGALASLPSCLSWVAGGVGGGADASRLGGADASSPSWPSSLRGGAPAALLTDDDGLSMLDRGGAPSSDSTDSLSKVGGGRGALADTAGLRGGAMGTVELTELLGVATLSVTLGVTLSAAAAAAAEVPGGVWS